MLTKGNFVGMDCPLPAEQEHQIAAWCFPSISRSRVLSLLKDRRQGCLYIRYLGTSAFQYTYENRGTQSWFPSNGALGCLRFVVSCYRLISMRRDLRFLNNWIFFNLARLETMHQRAIIDRIKASMVWRKRFELRTTHRLSCRPKV